MWVCIINSFVPYQMSLNANNTLNHIETLKNNMEKRNKYCLCFVNVEEFSIDSENDNHLLLIF